MNSIPPSDASSSILISSSSSQPPKSKLCTFCEQPSKYTCPRCHTPTCSLTCSNTHKSRTGCTGIRDKAAYVPLKEYGWGSMMDDYCFLEEVGRKVGETGREIVRGGFDMNVRGMVGVHDRRGRGRIDRGRGRGGGRGRERGGRGKGKREMLKVQLELKDIEVELLSNGMERRNLNQSVWDFKKQRALLTIQFKFHPPAEARVVSGAVQPFTLLTHRNDLSIPLLTLVQQHVKDRPGKKQTKAKNREVSSVSSTFPSWVPALILPPTEDPENFTTPTFVIAAPSDPVLVARSAALLSSTRNQNHQANTKPKPYYALDPNEPLLQSLAGTQFVEFPLIEVWEEFSGVIVDKTTGGVRRMGEVEPQRKRRKLNTAEGKKAINNLVGGYGSDGDDDDDDDDDDKENGLVGYLVSEGDDEMITEQDNIVDEEIEAEQDDEGEDVDVDPAVLLELMRQAKQQGKWVEEDDDEDSDDFSGTHD